MAVNRRVQFVSYDAPQYNKCDGVLTVKLDGNETVFGRTWDKACEGNHPSFWYISDPCYGGWAFDEDAFPTEFSEFYFELVHEFLENVEGCCCGGCR